MEKIWMLKSVYYDCLWYKEWKIEQQAVHTWEENCSHLLLNLLFLLLSVQFVFQLIYCIILVLTSSSIYLFEYLLSTLLQHQLSFMHFYSTFLFLSRFVLLWRYSYFKSFYFVLKYITFLPETFFFSFCNNVLIKLILKCLILKKRTVTGWTIKGKTI